MTRRGFTVNLILMVISIAVLLVLVLVGTSVFHLRVAARTDCLTRARNVAESAIHQTVAAMMVKPHFGEAQESIAINGPVDTALVTFDPQRARSESLGCSLNNLNGNAPRPADSGRTVPKSEALLVGRGRSGGVEVLLQAIVEIPPFPYAIASAGALQSDGGLVVESVPGIAVGGVVSNATDTLSLGSQNVVSGDVQGGGDISIDYATSQIGGEVRPHGDAVTLPGLNAASFDTESIPGVSHIDSSSPNPVLAGFFRSDQALHVQSLTLQGAVLYVNGDLQVDGPLQGNGALCVSGKTTLNGMVSLQTQDTVALVSDGDVSLSAASGRAAFRGLVVAGGAFQASNIDVEGIFLQTDPTSRTHLQNVHLTYNPAMSQIDVEITPPPGVSPLLFGGWQGLHPYGHQLVGATVGTVPTFRNRSGVLGNGLVPGTAYMQLLEPPPPPGYSYTTITSAISGIPVIWFLNARTLDPSVFYVPSQNRFMTRAEMGTLADSLPLQYDLGHMNAQEAVSAGIFYVDGGAQGRIPFNTFLAGKNLQALMVDIPATQALLFDAADNRLQALTRQYQEHVQATGHTQFTVYRVDLNEFINPDQSMRIRYWGGVK